MRQTIQYIQENNDSVMANFSLESVKGSKKGNAFIMLRENNCQPRILQPVKMFFKNKITFRQSETEKICCQKICTARNAKRKKEKKKF